MNTNLNEAKALEALPCPCCGGPSIVVENPEGFTVRCQDAADTDCDIGVIHRDWTRDKAIEIWNTRAPQPKATGTEASVCEDIAARQAIGLKKYGVSVADNPLAKAEWRKHLYNELADALIYLKREEQEEDKRIAQLEAELSEARAQMHRACVDLQGGEDVEIAAKRLQETNYANQQSVIRLSDQLTAANQRIEELSRQSLEALDFWKTYYEEEIDECELKAAACKGEGDMFGWNLYQGKLSGLVNHDIALTKFKNIHAAIAQTKTPQ